MNLLKNLKLLYKLGILVLLVISLYLIKNFDFVKSIIADEVAPTIVINSHTTSDGMITIYGTATDVEDIVSGVKYRRQGDLEFSPSSLPAYDGEYDESEEIFELNTTSADPQEIFEFMAWDNLNNTTGEGFYTTYEMDVNFGPWIFLNSYSGPSSGGQVTITGVAYDNEITNSIQYRDTNDETEGGWHNCTADDGVFDQIVDDMEGEDEPFTCTITGLDDETAYSFEIRGTDGDSNVTIPSSYIIYEVTNTPVVGPTLQSWFKFEDISSPIDTEGAVTYSTISTNAEANFPPRQVSWGYSGNAVNFIREGASKIIYTDGDGNLSYNGASKEFTVDFWIKPIIGGSLGKYFIMGKQNTAGDGFTWQIAIDGSRHAYAIVNVVNDSLEINERFVGLDNTNSVLTFGEWNHVQFAYKQAAESTIAIKVNNNPTVESTLYGESLPASTGSFQINDWNDRYTGYLDEIKIYSNYTLPDTISAGPVITFATKGAVTQADSYQITGNASFTSNIASVDFRLFDSSSPNEWSPCTASDGSYNSTDENFICTATGLSDETAYLYEFRATDNSGTPISTRSDKYGRYSLLRNAGGDIVAWLPMDQPNSPGDVSGSLPVKTWPNGDEYISNGLISYEAGVSGRSLIFNQYSSSFTLTDASSLLDFSGADESFKLSFWIRPSSTNSDTSRTIINKRYNETGLNSWQVTMRETGHIYSTFTAQNSMGYSVDTQYDSGNADLTYNDWNYVEISYDAVNKMVSTKINDNPAVNEVFNSFYTLPSSSGDLIIGEGMEGMIDDIRFYSTPGDYAPPAITVTGPANASRVTDNTPSIVFGFQDASTIVSAEYNVPAYVNEWVSITPDDLAWDETSETATVTLPQLSDGTYVIFVKATDDRGNTHVYNLDFGEYGYSRPDILPSYRFVVEATDQTAPDIFVYTIAPNPTIYRDVSIKGFVRDYTLLNEGDTASNIADLKYRIDGGEWVTVDNSTFDSPMEEFEISLSGLSTGTHTIELQATDAAGLTTDPIVGNPHSNVEESFEVIDQPDGLSVTAVSAEIDFRSHVLQDQLASSGVWGNGKLHLKPTLDFDYQALFEKDYFLFGYDFGKAEVSVSPAIDSGYLWAGTDRGDIMYLDKNTNAYTLYPSIHDSRVTQVTEFMAGSNRMLFISYYQSGTTILYDTKGTMSDIGDDTYVAYNSKTNFNVIDGTTYPSETAELYNRGFSVFAVDNTQATTALFVNLNNGEEAEDLGSYYIARIDTKNTFDIEDDTITYWGQSDGIRGDVVEDGFNDIIGTYFDADRNTLVLNSYVNGTYICDLGATPNDKSDDNCYKTTSGSIDTAAAFSIVEDDSNIYWFGGDAGIWTLDTKDTVATDDDVFALMVSIANIGNEHIQKMYWHEGDDPIGSEIIFATREGHIRVFNYNSTYTDTIDDVSYDFSLPDALYRTGNGFGYYIESDDTIWIGSQAVGVSKVEITRSYEDENTVIIIPPLPYGMAAANYFRLESIIGSVSTGSAYSLDDLTSYDISNDGGTTWEPIVYGETVFFPTAGDQLRFRITMTKGSTPILEYIKLVFHSYATTEEAEVYDPDMMISLNTGSGDNNNNSSSGNSGGSSSSGGSCGESAPGSAPYIWKVESLGGDKIKIYFNDSWQPVTDYHLVYGVQSGKYIHGGISVARYGDKSVIVSKLNPNLKYFFKLIPYNRCASGPWSNEVSIKSGSRYSILTNNVKNTVNQVTQKLTTSKSDIETSPVITPSVTPEYKMPAIQEPPKKETIFDKILKFFGLR